MIAAPPPPPPARVQVVEREFTLAFSRERLPAGPALVEVDNLGEDPHDLRLQRVGARHVAGTPVLQPGGRVTLSLQLLPGRYLVFCSLPGHRALGMVAILTVGR